MQKFQNLKFQDLTILQTLDETHNGTTKIHLCQLSSLQPSSSPTLYICKQILKSSIVSCSLSIQHIQNQKQSLVHFTSLAYPHICHLYSTFQDEQSLYLLLELVEGLPLHKLMKMMGTGGMGGRLAKILAGQIGIILGDVHQEGWVYRDVKLSNFVVGSTGRVKMVDLGKCKKIGRERTYTVCGTLHAMPPQVYSQGEGKELEGKRGYGYEFDYWGFGVLIYELIVGDVPFGYGPNKEVVEKVSKGLNEEILGKIQDESAKDLIKKLLQVEPSQRLGKNGGFKQILQHEFFKDQLDFAKMILDGKEELSPYDEDFCQFVSQIQDFGIIKQKYNQISQDDPFYNFL